MRRRTALQSILGAGALGQAGAQAPAQAPAGADDAIKLDTSAPDAVGQAARRFFTPLQHSTLTRLCQALVPAHRGRPSALDAEVPQFLDFLLLESPADRQTLYRSGLDRLEAGARQTHRQSFAALNDSQAAGLLSPLRAKWTWKDPDDVLARFLRDAKNDILRATANSRAVAMAAGSRRAAGLNIYWETIG